MGEITTVQLSKKFKEQLEKAKVGNESFEELLKRLLKGYSEGIENVSMPQQAFSLMFEGFDENGELNGVHEFGVTFKQLIDSEIGDLFVPNRDNSSFYNIQTAVVLGKDDSSCLVKITDKCKTAEIETEEKYVIAYHFF